jgi:hypothetical protein
VQTFTPYADVQHVVEVRTLLDAMWSSRFSPSLVHNANDVAGADYP